ncbi:25617_t:CDS:1 [Gigaspora margarita]|uniref:25617_t:CDS:1 n=1 Tax=Gigaspora margarita TaxID=4874 RepID=A0ABN7VDM3_GIGMA|nr:25617_t:CDS:1 [Gigaspora margarita]
MQRSLQILKLTINKIIAIFVLDLFEDSMDINQNKLTIKLAIDYIVDMWGNISEETIANCWKKTGILPIITEDDLFNITQIEQDILTHKEDNNQIIEDNLYNNLHANLLAAALNDYFCSLDKEIPTENILNENNIIKLIQNEIRSNEDSSNYSDDFEKEPEFVLLNNASKSLHTWVAFFDQQKSNEFKKKDIYIFKKYLKIVKKLEFQAKKQVTITDFFIHKD